MGSLPGRFWGGVCGRDFWRALLPLCCLWRGLQIAIHNLPELATFQDTEKMIFLMAGIVGLGVLIGFLSTFQAVNRYLGLTLDELY